MKKILSILIALSMLLSGLAALAESMDVQVIGGPETETEPVSLDDFKLNAEVTIDGYGLLLGTSFGYQDYLGYYPQGKSEPNWNNELKYESGKEAEYAILKMDITNIANTSKDFIENCEVKVIFDDAYEYAGWFYQYNYNNSVVSQNSHLWGEEYGKQNMEYVISDSDRFIIDPMYQGHYCFGCTLPNAVVNSKAPLRMVITIDGNELTYNIRK